MGTYYPPLEKKYNLIKHFDLAPESTYNIVLQYPEKNTVILMNLERPVRPGFVYALAKSPKLGVRVGEDATPKPSSSVQVSAVTP